MPDAVDRNPGSTTGVRASAHDISFTHANVWHYGVRACSCRCVEHSRSLRPHHAPPAPRLACVPQIDSHHRPAGRQRHHRQVQRHKCDGRGKAVGETHVSRHPWAVRRPKPALPPRGLNLARCLRAWTPTRIHCHVYHPAASATTNADMRCPESIHGLVYLQPVTKNKGFNALLCRSLP